MKIPMNEHNVSFDRLQEIAEQQPNGKWVKSLGCLYYTVIVEISNLKIDFTWFASSDAIEVHDLQEARALVAAADAEDEEE